MHKILPLFLIAVLGGLVVYSINKEDSNYNIEEFAADNTQYFTPRPRIIPPLPPTTTPTPRAIIDPLPPIPGTTPSRSTLTPRPTFVKPTPVDTSCVPDGRSCSDNKVCCGFCNRENGRKICRSLDEPLCIPKNRLCDPLRIGTEKSCCSGNCAKIDAGWAVFGICR